MYWKYTAICVNNITYFSKTKSFDGKKITNIEITGSVQRIEKY